MKNSKYRNGYYRMEYIVEGILFSSGTIKQLQNQERELSCNQFTLNLL